MNKTKVIISGLLIVIVILIAMNFKGDSLKPLPAPELAEGVRGAYGIDKNIDDQSIDNYLDREDTVYIDLRMLDDPASWENKGGERELTGFIKGFKVIPYPFLAGFSQEYRDQKTDENVDGLYDGPSLFQLSSDGIYTANYKESMDILEFVFPKDKNIFLICGAGGYARIAKEMLVELGWDKNKIYNLGGYWFYEGKNNIPVKNTKHGDISYDFWKVMYYNIDFKTLHKVN
ncbi:MAG: rhodanese-like domain-containing protein [Bacilli bacterium]|nr:rhodanese-like domain-containing protein [Bacilli bacterium]